jgi:two-component system, LuxR family, response regulator FixJ
VLKVTEKSAMLWPDISSCRKFPLGVKGSVFVVDDEEPLRNALRRLLGASGLPVRTFANAQEFLDALPRERPACLVLDLHMPGMTGLELQRELRARGLHIPVIFLTGAGTVTHAVHAMRGGAIDFIEKPFSNDELLERVKGALAADREALASESRLESVLEKASTLTPREKQVLILLSEGHSNKVIARRLDLSPRTVEGYRARIMDKLEAHSVAELVPVVQQCRHLLEGQA